MNEHSKTVTGPPAAPWQPPFSFEERVKHFLVPDAIYIRYRAWKEWLCGEPEIRLLRYLIDPERCAVDVGANKGVYSYFLSRYCRHVYAFEPNPKIYRILSRGAGRVASVTASPVALSDSCGSADLRVPRHRGGFSNQGASISAIKVPGNYRGVRVETARLDDLGLDNVGFIKIDVEGFELQVLKGARATIVRDRPALLVEIEQRFLDIPIGEAIRQIEQLGYRGLILLRGRLFDLAGFDIEHHQGIRSDKAASVNNFIFLPNGASDSGSSAP